MVLTSFDGKKEEPLMLTRCVEIPPLFGICLEINPIIKIVPICFFHNIQTESLSFQEFHPRLSILTILSGVETGAAKIYPS